MNYLLRIIFKTSVLYLFAYLSVLNYIPLSCMEHDKPFKILMVVPSFPKIHDVCMLNQITGLLDRFFDVTIYAQRLGDIDNIQQEVMSYNLMGRTIISEQLPQNLDLYDIVVFQLGHKAINIKKTHNFKGKVVICLRGYDITGFIQNNRHAYDEFFSSCDLFMPVCEAFKSILEKLGCNPKKIIVHHSGIDCSRFAFKPRSVPEQGHINILSAGRFVEKKGFAYAIMAVAQLIKKYPRIRYTIIGNGILKKNYKRLIKKLGMRNKITLIDWLPHDQYIKVMDRSHIFIAPSVTAADNDQEGIPNVLKEAMAMGLTVIATDHSGNNELVKDKESGLLISERYISAIVMSIEYILNNPDLLPTMQVQARTLVEEGFDNNKVNDRLAHIFLDLMGSS